LQALSAQAQGQDSSDVEPRLQLHVQGHALPILLV
jgi:hypothetical protein